MMNFALIVLRAKDSSDIAPGNWGQSRSLFQRFLCNLQCDVVLHQRLCYPFSYLFQIHLGAVSRLDRAVENSMLRLPSGFWPLWYMNTPIQGCIHGTAP